jgi:hypothetical protein
MYMYFIYTLKTVPFTIQRASVGIIGVFIGLPRPGMFPRQRGQPLLRDRLLVVIFAHPIDRPHPTCVSDEDC